MVGWLVWERWRQTGGGAGQGIADVRAIGGGNHPPNKTHLQPRLQRLHRGGRPVAVLLLPQAVLGKRALLLQALLHLPAHPLKLCMAAPLAQHGRHALCRLLRGRRIRGGGGRRHFGSWAGCLID